MESGRFSTYHFPTFDGSTTATESEIVSRRNYRSIIKRDFLTRLDISYCNECRYVSGPSNFSVWVARMVNERFCIFSTKAHEPFVRSNVKVILGMVTVGQFLGIRSVPN